MWITDGMENKNLFNSRNPENTTTAEIAERGVVRAENCPWTEAFSTGGSLPYQEQNRTLVLLANVLRYVRYMLSQIRLSVVCQSVCL